MPKNIIITCGTSLLNSKSITDDSDLLEKLDEIENPDIDITIFINYFVNNDFENIKTKKLKNFGAELNILKKVYENGDKIYLFFSETNGGKIIKSIFKEFFKSEKFKKSILNDNNLNYEEQINFITIEGFTVDNKELFQQQAIKNYFEKLEEIKKDGNQTIMCPVGGYKALIPYSSLYAMVQGWEIKYVYEDSDEIIDLPGGALSYYVSEKMLGNIDIDLKKVLDEKLVQKDISLDENLKILETLISFIKSGDLEKFIKSEYLNKVLKKVADKGYKGGFNKFLSDLKELDFYLKYCLLSNKKLQGIIEKISDLKKIVGDNFYIQKILKTILDEISKLKNYSEIEFKLNMLNWYKEKNRYMEFWLLAREFFIDLVSVYIFGKVINKDDIKVNCNNSSKDLRYDILESSIHIYFGGRKKNDNFCYLDGENDNKIKKLKKEEKLFYINKGNKTDFTLSELWEDIIKIRNATAHVGKINFNEKFYNLEDYFQKLQSFKNYILNN